MLLVLIILVLVIKNLKDVEKIVGKKLWKNFKLIKGDISNLNTCQKVENIDIVIHQAARGSIPKSQKPIATNNDNITGFLNILNCRKRIM